MFKILQAEKILINNSSSTELKILKIASNKTFLYENDNFDGFYIRKTFWHNLKWEDYDDDWKSKEKSLNDERFKGYKENRKGMEHSFLIYKSLIL